MASSSLLCRVHLLSPTPAQSQRIVEVLASALDTEGAWRPEASAGAVRLGDDAVLEVRALPSRLLATARHEWLKRPKITRLSGVSIETVSSGGSSVAEEDGEEEEDMLARPPPPSALANWQDWLSEARPRVTPTLSVSAGRGRPRRTWPATTSSSSSSSLLREVVLGASDLAAMVAALDGVGRPVRGRPNVFWLGDGPGAPALRLLPSPMSALVLRAPGKSAKSLEEVKRRLERRGVGAHPIGLTGASAGQLLLTAPELDGLDIRVCLAPEWEAPPVFFSEGEEVLRENVLEELNPSIDGGHPVDAASGNGPAASVPAAHYQRMMGGMGDCWSEFRAQLKRPGGFMKK